MPQRASLCRPTRRHSANKIACHLQTWYVCSPGLHTTRHLCPLVQPCWQGQRGQCCLSLCRITFHRAAYSPRLHHTASTVMWQREAVKDRPKRRSAIFSFPSLHNSCIGHSGLLCYTPRSASINKPAHFNEHVVLIYDVYVYGSRRPSSLQCFWLHLHRLSFNLPDLLESADGKSQKVTLSDLTVSSLK